MYSWALVGIFLRKAKGFGVKKIYILVANLNYHKMTIQIFI